MQQLSFQYATPRTAQLVEMRDRVMRRLAQPPATYSLGSVAVAAVASADGPPSVDDDQQQARMVTGGRSAAAMEWSQKFLDPED